jgi:hypothetical protein
MRLYTLRVTVIGGYMKESFCKKNPVVSRTIQMRGDQTLEDLHFAIFDALDRDEEHLYEFRFGKRPYDRKGPIYVHPAALDPYEEPPPAGVADETTLESLSLRVRRRFYYLFDFGDDWWHTIEVAAIGPAAPTGKYPKVTERVGKSPPQYPDFDD